MTLATVGIDMAKDTFQAELAINDKRKKKGFANTPEGFRLFEQWYISQGATELRVCLEATGRYGDAFVTYLFSRGYQVRVANPKRIRRFAESLGLLDKTDKVDAHGITEYALHHWERVQPWAPKSNARQALHDVRCHIIGLQKSLNAFSNRAGCGITEPNVLASLNRVMAVIEEELEFAQHQADELIESDQQLKEDKKVLLTQIGVGEVNATRMLTRIDFRAFRSGRQVGRFAGLTPRREQSGSSINKNGRISKEGPPDLRSVLFMAARSAMCHDPKTAEFAHRLRQRGKPTRIIEVAVMRKILLRSWALITKGTTYDPEYKNPLEVG